ncbi:hypothetical protein LXL04_028254 [Taraxacum kok-saghyz]
MPCFHHHLLTTLFLPSVVDPASIGNQVPVFCSYILFFPVVLHPIRIRYDYNRLVDKENMKQRRFLEVCPTAKAVNGSWLNFDFGHLFLTPYMFYTILIRHHFMLTPHHYQHVISVDKWISARCVEHFNANKNYNFQLQTTNYQIYFGIEFVTLSPTNGISNSNPTETHKQNMPSKVSKRNGGWRRKNVSSNLLVPRLASKVLEFNGPSSLPPGTATTSDAISLHHLLHYSWPEQIGRKCGKHENRFKPGFGNQKKKPSSREWFEAAGGRTPSMVVVVWRASIEKSIHTVYRDY